MTYVESLRNALHTAMEQDDRVVVLGEDILDPYGGAFKVTKGLSTTFPDRVFTTPICEASIAGTSVGMALRGLRPVAELMFGDFITLAADQLINHAAKYPLMYDGQVTVPLVVRTPMGGGRGYGPTHSQSLEKLFLGVPGLKVLAPSHVHDPGRMLAAAIADDEPILFIENKLLYPQRVLLEDSAVLRREVQGGDYPDIVLRNYPVGTKPDVTLISYGGLSTLIVPLMERLAEEEVHVIACFPGQLSPLKPTTILECVQETGRVVIVEEGTEPFGWGAEVAARIYEATGNVLKVPVRRVGAANTVIPAAKALEDMVLVSQQSIQNATLETLT